MSLYSSYSDGGHEGCRLPLEHLVDTQHETAAAMPLDSGDSVEVALDVADFQAETTMLRYSHDEIFSSLRDGLRGA